MFLGELSLYLGELFLGGGGGALSVGAVPVEGSGSLGKGAVLVGDEVFLLGGGVFL
jgi:hypothetical protein